MAKKILIVDDDPDILDVLIMILESKGYQVIGARDGLEALEKLEAEQPDLMILDLLMPKMDGFALYKELQNAKWSKYKEMPILVVTSVREEASRRRYELETNKELGVDDYIEKPFVPDTLLLKVEKLITRKRKHRLSP